MRVECESNEGAEPKTVVVVGNGMVSHRFCEQLRDFDSEDRWRIVVLGEETRPAYDRVALSQFFQGRSAEDLSLADVAWYEERNIDLRLGERVVEIDREQKVIKTDNGDSISFDRLVLATGSEPFVPPIPGTDTPGVFVYRTIDDLEKIRA